jgi:hypothetical protein
MSESSSNVRNDARTPRRLDLPHPRECRHRTLSLCGLRLLLAAYEGACQLDVDTWEFAVEARCLKAAGLTSHDLRWLVSEGHILLGVERAATRAERRSFRRTIDLATLDTACFVLTAAGAAYARHHASLQSVTAVVSRIDPRSFARAYKELTTASCNRLVQLGAGGRRVVPLSRLRALGVENDVLLALMYRDHIEHLRACPGPGDGDLRFAPADSVRLTADSCFALTSAGEEFAALGHRPEPESAALDAWAPFPLDEIVPHYDKQDRTLRWGCHVLKRFRQPSDNQELILVAAQELCWPAWFDDPLPRRTGKSPKLLLRDTIRDLNRRQTPYLIHFTGDGTGTRIGWEYR